MSSYDGLTQLPDHHRLHNFNALHRRSDSVESHGSVSSLSSNHSSVGSRNGVAPPSLGAAETSRFRRVEPPRTLNTSGCSPARNALHGTPRSSQPHSALLHSTSVMEAPRGQQALNRSRSGSCPMVWAANGSLREQHPIETAKPLHPLSNRWVYSPFASSPRGQPDRPLHCGQVTGSVQYAGGQHDDCRALGGARMPQGSSFLLPYRRVGDGVYDGIEPRDRYPSEQSLADYSQLGRRPRSSATGRASERYPSEQNLSDLAQSPGVVTSLQRSLSTMSVNAAPNSNFTSKLNCSLSRSFTSKLNDVARKGDEGGRPRKESSSGKQGVLSPRSPYEMGLCFNVPQPGGRVRKQREVFEREAPGSPVGKRENSPSSRKNLGFSDRSQFRHRSFENLNPMSKKFSLGSVFGDNAIENQFNSRGDNRRGAKMKVWTPDEDKTSARMNAHTPNDVKLKGGANAITPGEGRHNSRVHGYEKRDSLDLTLTPNENRRFETPTNCGSRGTKLHAPTTRETNNRRPATLLQSTENRPNGPSHSSGSFEGRPSRSLQALNATESWRPSNNGPSASSSFADRLRNISSNGPHSVGPVSSRGLFLGDPEITGSQPSLAQPSTFVSEVYVSIVKPRPGSGLPIERTVSLQPTSNSLSLCSPIYDNLPVSQSTIGASRSSLPLAGGGMGVVDGTVGEKAPWASAAAANSSTRRHSNPTEKVTEASPGVRAHVASQKEQLMGLLNDMKSLHLFRDKLRTGVGQMEKDTEDGRRTVTDSHFPTVYELERLYEANRQLKIEVQQLSHEIDRHRSKQSRLKKVCGDEVDVDSWSCSACTFSNHPALNRCECCDLPKLSFVMR